MESYILEKFSPLYLYGMNFLFFKGYNIGWFMWSFRIFELLFFCFVVAIFDLVHDVEAIFPFH